MLVPRISPEIWAVKDHETDDPNWIAKKIVLISKYDPVIGIYLDMLIKDDNHIALAIAVLMYDLINTQMEVNAMEGIIK